VKWIFRGDIRDCATPKHPSMSRGMIFAHGHAKSGVYANNAGEIPDLVVYATLIRRLALRGLHYSHYRYSSSEPAIVKLESAGTRKDPSFSRSMCR
jgi:hypothetical protein